MRQTFSDNIAPAVALSLISTVFWPGFSPFYNALSQRFQALAQLYSAPAAGYLTANNLIGLSVGSILCRFPNSATYNAESLGALMKFCAKSTIGMGYYGSFLLGYGVSNNFLPGVFNSYGSFAPEIVHFSFGFVTSALLGGTLNEKVGPSIVDCAKKIDSIFSKVHEASKELIGKHR